MTIENKLRGIVDEVDAAFTRHLKDAGTKTVTESCPECTNFQGQLAAFEKVRELLRAERRKHPVSAQTVRLRRIAEIIETVDNRAMAADGPVTPTLEEMTQAEMSEIYRLAKGRRKK